MRKKVLLIGTAAVAATLVGGWALAQSYGPGFGPPFMHGEGPGGMGPGMMRHMGPGMGPGTGPGMMRHMHGGMGPGGRGFAFADQAQVDKLKTELAITPAQEPAKYTKTVQDAAATMKTAHESVDPATVGKMNAQDRYAFATKMREQGQKQFEAVKNAADELFKTLDDTQKAKALDILPGLAFGPRHKHAAGVDGPFHRQ